MAGEEFQPVVFGGCDNNIQPCFILDFVQGINEIRYVHISSDRNMCTIVASSKGTDYCVAFKGKA